MDQSQAERNRILAESDARQTLRQFERALIAGERPRIEDVPAAIAARVVGSHSGPKATSVGGEMVPPFDSTRWQVLLEELLHMEIEYRAKHSEAVSLEEYLQRFPELMQHTECQARLRETVRQCAPAAGASPDKSNTNPNQSKNASRKRQKTRPGSGETIPQALRDNSEYKVISEINRGAMGVVYLVRNRQMDRLEALKVIQQALLEDRSGAVQRFKREMRAAAQLNHPNIVTAYSSPPLPDLLAFAMEFIDGINLYDLVRSQGPLPISNACYYANQAAQGLQHAHERQLVHRDIKPRNLMLLGDDDRQIVKVLDFGLAKATSEIPVDGGLTGAGQMIGTPHYMAPEQIENAAKADIRADIYSLGCTLYHLLCGHAPFQQHESLYGILRSHENETAPLLDELRPEISTDLAAIVAKMMAKDPAERFQEPAEVARALVPFFSQGINRMPLVRAALPQRAAVCAESETATFAARPTKVELPELKSPTPSPLNSSAVTPVPATLSAPVESEKSSHSELNLKQRKPAGRQSAARTKLLGLLCGLSVVALLIGWQSGIFEKRYNAVPVRATESAKVETAAAPEPTAAGITNSIGMILVPIPAGEFMMGNDESVDELIMAFPDAKRERFSNAASRHRVRITHPFLLGKYEVTIAQFRRFVEATGYQTDAETDGQGGWGYIERIGRVGYRKQFNWRNTGFAQGDDHPVVNVSWNDATAYCKWLTQTEQVQYRLPTEAEWEYACRAGRETRYSNGNDPQGLIEIGNTADASVIEKFPDADNQLSRTDGHIFSAPVGKYQPNAFGLCDMHGNVSEWCADWYNAGYYENSPVDDPQGPATGPGRVFRGGSWHDDAPYCRSAHRRRDEPDYRVDLIGFRVIRSVER